MDEVWTHTGQIWPMGIPIAQSWLDIGALLKIIHEQRVRFVYEIGVHRGGLAALLIARPGLRYSGIEIDRTLIDSHIPTTAYRIGDAWESAMIAQARELIDRTDGPAFILCDGGDKRRDLAAYAPLVRPGDLIAVHDFGKEIHGGDVDPPPPGLVSYRPDWLTVTNWYVLRRP